MPADPKPNRARESRPRKRRRRVAAPLNEKLLLTQPEAIQLVGVSLTRWKQLRSAGGLPEPVDVAGSRMWRRADLERWTAGLKTTRAGGYKGPSREATHAD